MRLGLAAIAALTALPVAHASDEDFQTAAASGPWSGCVFEEGYAPYPIVLTPRGKDFFVSYPGLCTGGHIGPDLEAPYDAIEIIIVNADKCLQGLPMVYTLSSDELRIDYLAAGKGTFALLRQTPPGKSEPACSAEEAVS